jgi:uncharacterized protein DUF6177
VSEPAADQGDRGGEAGHHPAVDVLTDRATVVMQDRQVVGLSAWLASAARASAAAGREFQLVAGQGCRLTFPLRTLLGGPATRWVVPDPVVGYYDGLSGRPLFWDGAWFTQSGDGPMELAPAFGLRLHAGLAPLAAVTGRQLVLTARLRQASTAATMLGRAAELACASLTGAPPAGWGTAEPVTEPWRPAALTGLARRRAPRPSWFTLVGAGERPAAGTLRVERAASGVDEVLTLAVGYQGQPPVERLAGLAGELAGTGALVSLLAQVRPGRADLTFAPRWEGLPVPAGLAVGAGGRGTGPDRDWPGPALAVPLAGTRLVGTGARAAVWFPLGDGASPVGWQALKLVAEHLRPGTRPSGWT